MSTRLIVLSLVLVLLVGYAFGRYVVPGKETIKVQTVTVEHTHTVTITVHDKDGSSTTTTTTDTGSTTAANSSTVITNNKPLWKVSGLGGLNVHSLSTPIYGGEVEHRLVGPISVGVWGLSNSTGGVSLSLEF
jgi:predicted Zn-dependent protease